MATPLDIITGSLRAVGGVAGGESPDPAQANDAFALLNDLLDQLSNEKQMIFCVQEVIHELVGNQQVYPIGPGGVIGASFNGTVSGNVLTVSSLLSGALSVGQTLSATVSAAGPITGLSVQPGALFTTQPTLSFAGDGVGATGTIYLQFSPGSQPTMAAAGASYTAGELLTVLGGTPIVPATVRVATIGGGGSVTSVVTVSPGQYTVPPTGTVALSGSTGSGATLNAPSMGIGPAFITNPGIGYTFCTVTVVGGGGGIGGAVAAIIGGTPILPGTAITSYGTAQGGTGPAALGTYFLNLSQVGGSASMTSTAPRPLRINSAFVRVVNSLSGTLDYPVSILNIETWERIGQKTMPGPWPYSVYYQPSEPVGILNYYPNPAQGEMHLFCDTVLNRFSTMNDTIVLPQGYAMALRWMLAEILMVEYPATAAAAEVRAMIPAFAMQGRAVIKRMNMQPPPIMTFDPILSMAKKNDAGWILTGGFT